MNKIIISEIIKSLKSSDTRTMCNAIEELRTIDNEEALPELIKVLKDEELVVSDSGNNLIFTLLAITRIQKKCKFYNHEIYHSPPVEEEDKPEHHQQTVNNFNNCNFDGLTNFGNNYGSQIGSQNL